MMRIKRFALSLLAASALVALAASTAQAASTEGPWIDVSGKRLGPGETRALFASSEGPLLLFNKTAGIKIECKSAKPQPGDTINGSTGKNPGTGLGVPEFTNCIGGGRGESLTTCEPEGGRVFTQPVVGILGYSNPNRTGEILILSKPATGNTFDTIKFTGSECVASTTTVTGSIVGLWLRAGTPVQVGEEFLSSKLLFSFVASSKPSTFFYETNGEVKSLKPGLVAFGTSVIAEGVVEGELANGALVGILTGCSACTGFGA